MSGVSTGEASVDPLEILPLTRELCRFQTSVVADENEAMFDRLCRELPFELLSYRSGEEHNGWVVQPNWRVKKATLKYEGEVVFDGLVHPLAVAMNSRSFTGTLDLGELKPHLVTNSDIPDAHVYHCIWQIRNWDPDWALSIPYRIYENLKPGEYEVDLVTETEPGEMLVAVFDKPGRTDDVILFNTNTCHPTQANDGFAAVALLVRLFQRLAERETHYTYRLILAPEHMGSVFYMRDRSHSEIDKMKSCIFAEMPGTDDPVTIASTFLGDQVLDRAFHNVVRHSGVEFKQVGWRNGVGNDETVWEAPGYEIPTVEVTRSFSPDRPYREYHSSLDTPDLMKPDRLYEFLDVLENVIEVIEDNVVAHRKFDGLICLSNPKYQLYFERHDPAIDKGLTDDDEKWGHLLDMFFRYLDGTKSTLEIAETHDLPFRALRRYLEAFSEKDLVDLSFSPIDRPSVQRRKGSTG